MKRYIRLKDNTIVDLDEFKEKFDKRFNKTRYTWYEDDKLIGIFDTLDESIVEYFYKYKIVAESDNITDLIMVGDLIEIKDRDTEEHSYLVSIVDKEQLKRITVEINWYDIWLEKLYTKQGDNYILVWDKERGVI